MKQYKIDIKKSLKNRIYFGLAFMLAMFVVMDYLSFAYHKKIFLLLGFAFLLTAYFYIKTFFYKAVLSDRHVVISVFNLPVRKIPVESIHILEYDVLFKDYSKFSSSCGDHTVKIHHLDKKQNNKTTLFSFKQDEICHFIKEVKNRNELIEIK